MLYYNKYQKDYCSILEHNVRTFKQIFNCFIKSYANVVTISNTKALGNSIIIKKFHALFINLNLKIVSII